MPPLTSYYGFWYGQQPYGGQRSQFAIGKLSQERVDTAGGETITIEGIFPIGYAIRAHMGPLGTIFDPFLGSYYSEDGLTLEVVTLPIVKGDHYVTIQWGTRVAFGSISVVEKPWRAKIFRLQQLMPRWYVGRRTVDEEGRQ
jgi:hypothetical protein